MSEYNNQSSLVSSSIAIRSNAIRLAYVILDQIVLFLIYIVEMFSSFYIVIKRSTIYILTNYKLETKRVTYLLFNQIINQYK